LHSSSQNNVQYAILTKHKQGSELKFENVVVASLSYEDAPIRVTSEEIEMRLVDKFRTFGITPGMLEMLTGIKARHVWSEDVQPSDVATIAAKKAISAADINKNQIGVLINTSVCKDYIEPAVAALVHGNLKMPDTCMNFDIGNACLAFLNGMQVIGNMIERGQIDYGLIVDGENSRHVVDHTICSLLKPDSDSEDFRNNLATLTLGSGAVAMVLARKELMPEKPKYFGGITVAATEHNQLCKGQRDGMTTDAKNLLLAGVELAEKTLTRATDYLGWDFANMDQYIVHQVSHANTDQLANRLKMDKDKIFITYDEFGNIGPASLPTTLAKAVEAGRIKKGDKVALMGIGSGINCSMMQLEW
jgi:3-oxoacyl-[acyl-carrier-protein] synthase-3